MTSDDDPIQAGESGLADANRRGVEEADGGGAGGGFDRRPARCWSNRRSGRTAKAILFYAPLPEELDIWRLLEDSLAAGKTVALPRFQPEQGRLTSRAKSRRWTRTCGRGNLGSGSRGSHCATIR